MERLTTGRLLLRAFEPEDLQSLYAYCSEPDTGIHADKKPHESIEESRQLLNQLMQEDLTWAICDNVSGKNIGAVWLREEGQKPLPGAGLPARQRVVGTRTDDRSGQLCGGLRL